ncbi:MAG: FeoA family protein [Vicinamibacterales bacterium]
MPTAAVPLTELPPGALARFEEARLDPEAIRLLRALGLVESCEFRLCQSGEPYIVQVRATRIGLSRAVARSLLVVPSAPGAD